MLFVFRLLKLIGLLINVSKPLWGKKSWDKYWEHTAHHFEQVHLLILHLFICMLTKFHCVAKVKESGRTDRGLGPQCAGTLLPP